MNQPTEQEPRNARLREIVMAVVASVAIVVLRYREAEKALAKNEGTLSAAEADRETHAQARGAAESMSAVELHRRDLTAADAAAQADTESSKEKAAQDRVEKADAERGRLTAQQREDLTLLKKTLPDLSYRASVLGESEFVAEIGTMIDLWNEHVPVITEGASDRLFTKTKANQIYHDRALRIKKADSAPNYPENLVAIAEEIIAEPIVPLRQRPPTLLHPNNSVLVRAVEQILQNT